jgi:hypothetical protein
MSASVYESRSLGRITGFLETCLPWLARWGAIYRNTVLRERLRLVTESAFVRLSVLVRPPDEPITSGLPVIHPQFVDRPSDNRDIEALVNFGWVA